MQRVMSLSKPPCSNRVSRARAAGSDELEIEIDIAREVLTFKTRALKGRLAFASRLGCPSLAPRALDIRLCESTPPVCMLDGRKVRTLA